MKEDHWSIEVVNTTFKIYLCVKKRKALVLFLKQPVPKMQSLQFSTGERVLYITNIDL